MYTQVEKSKENKSRAVANSVNQKKNDVKQKFGFVDNRPEAFVQRKLNEIPNSKSVNSTQFKDVLQNMTVRTNAVNSVLSAITSTKHVEPAATQNARATNEYGSRTFVTNAADITNVVNADNHNFTEANGVRSGRHDFQSNVTISQYMKTPPNLGAGDSVNQTINNAATLCEIGVVKNGEDALQVTHFKKV